MCNFLRWVNLACVWMEICFLDDETRVSSRWRYAFLTMKPGFPRDVVLFSSRWKYAFLQGKVFLEGTSFNYWGFSLTLSLAVWSLCFWCAKWVFLLSAEMGKRCFCSIGIMLADYNWCLIFDETSSCAWKTIFITCRNLLQRCVFLWCVSNVKK